MGVGDGLTSTSAVVLGDSTTRVESNVSTSDDDCPQPINIETNIENRTATNWLTLVGNKQCIFNKLFIQIFLGFPRGFLPISNLTSSTSRGKGIASRRGLNLL